MTRGNRNVLLVPGLHPRGCEVPQRLAYKKAISSWSAEGFDVTLQQFGWNDELSLTDRQAALFETINGIPGRISTIGASAGALAVIGAFKEFPEKFDKVITIAAPLHVTEAEFAHFRPNPVVPIPDMLRESYEQADNFLSTCSIEGLSKITSLYGQHDPRVPPHWSQRSGIEGYQLPTRGHGRTIAGALRKHRKLVQSLLTDG